MPVATAALALALAGPAQAQDAVKLEVIRKGQVGLSNPGLVLLPKVGAERLDAKVACGGATAAHTGGADAGDRIVLELAVNPGVYTCTGTLDAAFEDGSSGSMPLSFDITMFPPLGITVDKSTIDLARGQLEVVMDRPSDRVQVTSYGFQGEVLGQGQCPGMGAAPGTPISCEWSPAHPEVLRLEVKGTDVDGFWGALELFPWYYEIPHEDVNFETAKAEIRPGEVPKLDEAWGRIQEVVAKYGPVAKVNLYIAGYTDTVGDRSSNEYLSEQRAAAIARWFRTKGFTGGIYFQGFGESGLAVSTPDEVDEAANRRAAYVVAAEPPPVTAQMPRTAWKKIQ